MLCRVRRYPARVLLLSLLVLSALAATLAFRGWNPTTACTHAQGRLFNATELGGPGRMIGTVTGTYWYDGSTYDQWDPDGSDVIFNSGASTVEGKHGTIAFQEYAALDLAEQERTNGAVLLVVTGGTGKWDGASGHLTLSGYFHTDTFEGVWDYQGEICTP